MLVRQSNLDRCIDAIENLGYRAESFLIDAQWYGLATSRRRVYIVCWRVPKSGASGCAKTFFENFGAIIRKLYIPAPDAAPHLQACGQCAVGGQIACFSLSGEDL